MVESHTASRLSWLNTHCFWPDLFSHLSLLPWACGCVSSCSALCVQAGRADCWVLHQGFFERPPASEQVAGSTSGSICLLVGLGDYFSQWTILSVTFLLLCALQAPPPWDTHHPAFCSRLVLPFSMLWLPPQPAPSQPSSMIPLSSPQAATISLTLGYTGKMCGLGFTPRAGTASQWSWFHQVQLTHWFQSTGKQPCCPPNYRMSASSVTQQSPLFKEGKEKYISASSHTSHSCIRRIWGLGAVSASSAPLLLGCVIPCYARGCRQRKENRSDKELLPVSLPTAQFDAETFLEQGAGKS